MELNAERVGGDAERRGGGGVVEVLLVDEEEQRALRLGELRESALENFFELGGAAGVVALGRGHVVEGLGRERLGGFAAAAAQLVEEEIARDVEEIGREGGAALVARGGAVEAHEDFEREVFGFGHGAERAVEKREERLLPFVEQLLPRALVAGGAAGETAGVFVGDFWGRRGIGLGGGVEDAEQPVEGSGKCAGEVHRWDKPRR